MFSASIKTSTPSGSGPDPQFNYVTMLLHGDGTNGAQNNTFVDSSTNNFTITRNGNTTQGSFSPYGPNWSNNFNGTDATLDFPNSSNFAFGTGSFTIEFWINAPLDGDKFVLGGRSAITNMHITSGGGGTGTTTGVLRYVATSTIVSSNVITDNTWHHCAIVRNGSSNITLYVDGVSVGTGTDTSNYTQTSGTWYIARNDLGAANFLNGYLSNLRIVKGTAVYTSNFTPSTTPLTAISGTSLLTCQSNRFVDNSATPVTITPTKTSVQRFNPFGTATAYSTSVISGSGYFDGSGDYLATPLSTAFGFGTGDFTFEAWVYSNSLSSTQVICDVTLNKATLYLNTSNLLTIYFSGLNITGLPVTPFAWNHVACVRSSGLVKTYVNGVGNTATSVTNDLGSSEQMQIGVESGSYFNGYISNFRAVKGTAVYTSNFTPPTAPVTAISGTSLLTNFTNGAIFDNAMINDLETVGNAQISTSVVKYGTGSLAFDGTADYLSLPNTTTSTPSGVGSWTIEGWIYPTSNVGGFRAIYVNGYPIQIFLSNNTIEIYISSSTSGGGYFVSGLTGPTNSISANVWTHFAVVNNANSYTVYVNGVSGSTTTSATAIAFPTNPNATIGDAPVFGAYGYTGYIDDFRITKGFARYTANFTPPSSAFSNTGPI